MATIQKKICMIGDFSVGKTSLVARYVRQTFSEKYLTTVGVKIDTKVIELSAEKSVKLVLWDIAGSDGQSTITASYLRGAAGYLLVVDGTRRPTWHNALTLRQSVIDKIGDKPFIILLNKADLEDEWELEEELVAAQQQQGWIILKSSAKTGLNVENAFITLAERIV